MELQFSTFQLGLCNFHFLLHVTNRTLQITVLTLLHFFQCLMQLTGYIAFLLQQTLKLFFPLVITSS